MIVLRDSQGHGVCLQDRPRTILSTCPPPASLYSSVLKNHWPVKAGNPPENDKNDKSVSPGCRDILRLSRLGKPRRSIIVSSLPPPGNRVDYEGAYRGIGDTVGYTDRSTVEQSASFWALKVSWGSLESDHGHYNSHWSHLHIHHGDAPLATCAGQKLKPKKFSSDDKDWLG